MLDRPFSTLNTNQFREQICGTSPLSPSQFEQNPFISQNHPWKTWQPQPQQYNGVYNYCCCPQIPPPTNFCNNPSVVFTFQTQPPPRPVLCSPFQNNYQQQQQQIIVPPSNFQLEMLRFQQMRMNEIENRNAVEQFCRQFQNNSVPFQFTFYKDYGTLPETLERSSNTLKDSGNQTHFCCECSHAEKASGEQGKAVGNSEESSLDKNEGVNTAGVPDENKEKDEGKKEEQPVKKEEPEKKNEPEKKE